MNIVSKEEALEFVNPYFGKPVSRVWQGYGSAIFLEVGDLTNDKGELTIMIQWSWRVEKGHEIAFGSWSSDSDFSEYLKQLNGLSLKTISFESRLPEIVVELTNDTWVCSFSTVEGDPEWALMNRKQTLMSSKGKLVFE